MGKYPCRKSRLDNGLLEGDLSIGPPLPPDVTTVGDAVLFRKIPGQDAGGRSDDDPILVLERYCSRHPSKASVNEHNLCRSRDGVVSRDAF